MIISERQFQYLFKLPPRYKAAQLDAFLIRNMIFSAITTCYWIGMMIMGNMYVRIGFIIIIFPTMFRRIKIMCSSEPNWEDICSCGTYSGFVMLWNCHLVYTFTHDLKHISKLELVLKFMEHMSKRKARSYLNVILGDFTVFTDQSQLLLLKTIF